MCRKRKYLVYCLFFRYEQWRDVPQPRPSEYEDCSSRNNEDVLPYYSGTLESSKNSGLSSSSFELSQYINGAELSEAPPSSHPGESTPEGSLLSGSRVSGLLHALHSSSEHLAAQTISAPLKYAIPHAVVSFGPAGQLIRVSPGVSTQENVSQLEIHSLEVSGGVDPTHRWWSRLMEERIDLNIDGD